MDKVKVIHDTMGHTLTIWLGDPAAEYICEETTDEVILMKDKAGEVIGFELLHYHPRGETSGLTVETLAKTAP